MKAVAKLTAAKTEDKATGHLKVRMTHKTVYSGQNDSFRMGNTRELGETIHFMMHLEKQMKLVGGGAQF